MITEVNSANLANHFSTYRRTSQIYIALAPAHTHAHRHIRAHTARDTHADIHIGTHRHAHAHLGTHTYTRHKHIFPSNVSKIGTNEITNNT